MTVSEFRKLCEDVSYNSADEDWSSVETLRAIASEIQNVAIDFNGDVAMLPDFGESILDA